MLIIIINMMIVLIDDDDDEDGVEYSHAITNHHLGLLSLSLILSYNNI